LTKMTIMPFTLENKSKKTGKPLAKKK